MPFVRNKSYTCDCPCGWTATTLSSSKGMLIRLNLHRKVCEVASKITKYNHHPNTITIEDENYKVLKIKLDPDQSFIVPKDRVAKSSVVPK